MFPNWALYFVFAAGLRDFAAVFRRAFDDKSAECHAQLSVCAVGIRSSSGAGGTGFGPWNGRSAQGHAHPRQSRQRSYGTSSPQVDAFLLNWLIKGPLRRQWFLEERNGNCRLMSSLANRLSESSELWRRAIVPFAEGIARALWSSRAMPEGSTSPPATRLSQNHKRAAKGLFASASVLRPALQESICRVCAATIKSGQKYCRGYVPTISRENVLRAGAIGRLNTHKPEAQAKRSQTQRCQNAALKAWNPNDKPDWLDEQAYKKRVFPHLSRITVPTIMAALSVSEPYALRIRSGRCIPHARHWVRLARLAGEWDLADHTGRITAR